MVAVEYDLVILGETWAGYEAARCAAEWGARVALVRNGETGDRARQRAIGIRSATRRVTQAQALNPFQADVSSTPTLNWSAVQQWADLTATTLGDRALETCLAEGVDVIADRAQFRPGRSLGVETSARSLTTRCVLLATEASPAPPEIPGFEHIPHHSPASLLALEALPPSAIVLGHTPAAVEISQTLALWGVAVTLVTAAPRLLPTEPAIASDWITAQLMADGVAVWTGTVPSAVTAMGDGVQIAVGDRTLEAAQLVLATTPRPKLDDLNLAAVGLDESAPRLHTNRYLQTHNPRVYGCGAVLGGYGFSAIARHEARVATENALFWPRRPIRYEAVPYHMGTLPPYARVGLSPAQARHRYPTSVQVYALPWHTVAAAHWQGTPTGFGQWIIRQDGKVLGAQLLGPGADDLCQALAWMMATRCSLRAIAAHPSLPDSLADVLHQVAWAWQRDRWQPGHWRRDWAENWFNWRRSRPSHPSKKR